MTRFNFHLDLSSDIYDNLIEPLKARRGVNAFVRRIFEVYLENEYVRAIVDGEEVVNKEFEDLLSEAREGVSSIADMSSSFTAQTASGRTAFEEGAFGEEFTSASGAGLGGGSSDLDSINQRLDSLSSSVEMLVSALLGGSAGVGEGIGDAGRVVGAGGASGVIEDDEETAESPTLDESILSGTSDNDSDNDSDSESDNEDAFDDFDDFEGPAPVSVDSGFDDFDDEEDTSSPADKFNQLSGFTIGGL